MPKRWSTKDPIIVEAPSAGKTGTAFFRFTDDYSVFHYSKMPDKIPGKGEAMARMASTSLRMIRDAGLPTHFLDFAPPDRMLVRFVRILDPAEQPLQPTDFNRLVPLQVICRNALPQGSSVFRRLAARLITTSDIGLTVEPAAGETLAHPIIEVTPKLEEIDRYISTREAQSIAGLDDRQFSRIKELTLAINQLITRHANALGLEHADSKVEFAIDDKGDVMLVDTAGTLDENRFLRNGVHVSKQLMRNFYLPFGLEEDVQQWVARKRPRYSWPQPQRLPPAIIDLASDLYRSMAELWTGQVIWKAPDVDSVAARIRALSANHR
jgi:phosphoribosylaminoimidazole-succinocarboxamide synthase